MRSTVDEETIAERLARIESKLDEVLEFRDFVIRMAAGRFNIPAKLVKNLLGRRAAVTADQEP